MNAQKILVIIPAFNEEFTIKDVVDSTSSAGYDYIVVNDGSNDNTRKILDENNFNHIDLIFNLGIGGAVQTGYKYANKMGYDIAIQLDADGQHDISYVEKIVKPIIDGEADLVIGSRFTEKTLDNFRSTAMRRFGIKMISNVIKILSRKRIYDTTSGFRAANRKVIELFANSYPLEYPEPVSEFMLLKNGLKVKEVSAKMRARNGGRSSIHSWRKGYYMINVIISILMIQFRSKKK